jgi:YggT family protein
VSIDEAAAGGRMIPILNFTQFILQTVLTLIIWIVFAYVVLSWLISFQVVNTRNRVVWQISRFLEGVAGPLLRPFRRLVPSLGGLDFSPFLLLILIVGTQRYLIPPLFEWLRGLFVNSAAVSG